MRSELRRVGSGTRTKVILQVALDFLELPRALRAGREAVEGGADWLEAGTPLIKSEGLDAVRELRKEFPTTKIVADLKTMDAGRLEVESAAKAGADVAVVLGCASRSTIDEALRVAENYGAEIAIDMLGVDDPIALAKWLEETSVSHIHIHTAIDEQMRGRDPFELVRRLSEEVSVPIAVAGGINSESAPEAVRAGASIVVVGGAITKSPDATEATRKIRAALDTLAPVPTRHFKRVSEENVLDVLREVSTANISDAMHRAPAIEGLVPIGSGLKIVGRALTVRAYPGDWSKPVEAIDVAEAGQVLVVDAGGVGPALWGELATNSAVEKGLGGAVVWGAVRDAEEVRRLKFPLFAKLVCPNAGEPKGLGEIGVPVRLAGITVRTGDWVTGDDDGVVVIPKERAVEIANRAMDVLERENRIRGEIKKGKTTLGQITELLKWEKQIG